MKGPQLYFTQTFCNLLENGATETTKFCRLLKVRSFCFWKGYYEKLKFNYFFFFLVFTYCLKPDLHSFNTVISSCLKVRYTDIELGETLKYYIQTDLLFQFKIYSPWESVNNTVFGPVTQMNQINSTYILYMYFIHIAFAISIKHSIEV